MKNGKKDRLAVYLLWAFGIAWALQIAAAKMLWAGDRMAYTALLSASMFAPLLAAVLSGAGLRGMGWKPRLKGNLGWIVGAWFVPAILGTRGAQTCGGCPELETCGTVGAIHASNPEALDRLKG